MSTEKNGKKEHAKEEALAKRDDVTINDDRDLVKTETAAVVKTALVEVTPFAPPPSNYSLAGYPGLVTNTGFGTPATVANFKPGLQYTRYRRVGETVTGTVAAPVVTDQYIPVNKTVDNGTGLLPGGNGRLNQDLLEFEQDIAKGNAYNPV